MRVRVAFFRRRRNRRMVRRIRRYGHFDTRASIHAATGRRSSLAVVEPRPL